MENYQAFEGTIEEAQAEAEKLGIGFDAKSRMFYIKVFKKIIDDFNARVTGAFEEPDKTETFIIYCVDRDYKKLDTESQHNIKLKAIEFETFKKFGSFFKEPEKAGKYNGYFVRSGDVKLYDEYKTNSGKHYTNIYPRCDGSLNSACLLVIDADKNSDGGNAAHLLNISDALTMLGINHFGHTTHSQTAEVNKCRVMIPCHMSHKKQLVPTIHKLISELNDFNPDLKLYVNGEMKRWSQPWYLANRDDPDDGLFEYVEFHNGKDYEAVDAAHTSGSNEQSGTYSEQSNSESIPLDEIKRLIKEWIPGTGRHDAIIAYNWGLIKDTKRQRAFIISDTEQLMYRTPESKRDEDWYKYFADIPRFTDGGIKKFRDKEGEKVDKADVFKSFDLKPKTFDAMLDDSILMPDDAFGSLVNSIYKTMWTPNKMSAFQAALSIVSYVAGGQYRGKSKNDTTNVYLLGVGHTGAGKGVIVESPNVVLDEVFIDTPDLWIKSKRGVQAKIKTEPGLEDLFIELDDRPDVLYCWDEFGLAMQAIATGADKWGSGVLNYALELWPVAYASRAKRVLASKDDGTKPIMHAPHLSISGASTEGTLIKGITHEFIESGKSARIIMFPVGIYEEPNRKFVDDLELTEEVAQNLITLFTHTQEPAKGNIASIFGGAVHKRIRNPNRIDWNDEVIDFYHEYSNVDHGDKEGIKHLIRNRSVVNLKKLAMLRACINNPACPVVTLEIAQWAKEVIEYSCGYQEYLFQDLFADNKYDACEKAVINYLNDAGGKWVSQKDLCALSQMRQLEPFRRKGFLDYLVNDVQTIERKETDNKRGPKSYVYRCL